MCRSDRLETTGNRASFMSYSISACACATSVCASSKAPCTFLHSVQNLLACDHRLAGIDPVPIVSSASPTVTGASPSSPPHWVHCHSGKREPDWARHPVAFLSWRRWRRLTTSDHEPMLRRKDKSQSKQWHAKRILGSWQCADAICQSVNLATCQPVNLSLSNELSHVCR